MHRQPLGTGKPNQPRCYFLPVWIYNHLLNNRMNITAADAEEFSKALGSYDYRLLFHAAQILNLETIPVEGYARSLEPSFFVGDLPNGYYDVMTMSALNTPQRGKELLDLVDRLSLDNAITKSILIERQDVTPYKVIAGSNNTVIVVLDYGFDKILRDLASSKQLLFCIIKAMQTITCTSSVAGGQLFDDYIKLKGRLDS